MIGGGRAQGNQGSIWPLQRACLWKKHIPIIDNFVASLLISSFFSSYFTTTFSFSLSFIWEQKFHFLGCVVLCGVSI